MQLCSVPPTGGPCHLVAPLSRFPGAATQVGVPPPSPPLSVILADDGGSGRVPLPASASFLHAIHVTLGRAAGVVFHILCGHVDGGVPSSCGRRVPLRWERPRFAWCPHCLTLGGVSLLGGEGRLVVHKGPPFFLPAHHQAAYPLLGRLYTAIIYYLGKRVVYVNILDNHFGIGGLCWPWSISHIYALFSITTTDFLFSPRYQCGYIIIWGFLLCAPGSVSLSPCPGGSLLSSRI